MDASQLVLHELGANGYEMWDGDGNHHKFEVSGHVTGFDDPTSAYFHDFGASRDGWYLTSLSDPFLNSYSVTYRTDVTPCWQYNGCTSPINCPPTSAQLWVPDTITLPTGSIRVLWDGANRRVSGIEFPVTGTARATWTLQYGTQAYPGMSGATCTVSLQTITELDLPTSGLKYRFGYAPNCGGVLTDWEAFLNHLELPTGEAIDYVWSDYSFYHGRAAASFCQNMYPPPLGEIVNVTEQPNCQPGRQGNAPPGDPCSTDDPVTYADNQPGIIKRTETIPQPSGGPITAETAYTQYAFPYGERGGSPGSCYPYSACSQTLTIVLAPPDVDGRRAARGYLFWSGPHGANVGAHAGDRTSADIEERWYTADPNVAFVSQPACPSAYSFCADSSLVARVSRRTYDYEQPAAELHNRRVLSEEVCQSALTPGGACGSKSHTTTFSPSESVSPGTWESNGRHYTTETHSGNLGNDDYRAITTVWAPSNWTAPAGTVLPNLYTQRTEFDSTLTVDKYFYFDATNGFLNGVKTRDTSVSPNRVLQDCRYKDGAGNVAYQVTATETISPPPAPLLPCLSSFSAWPQTFGQDNDSFAKYNEYQNGQRTKVRWIVGGTPAIWYAKRLNRDSPTGWITDSFDSAGKGTNYQYDSVGRVTQITPPDGEAATVVSYPSGTRTTASRNGGLGLVTYLQYEYDGLGRTAREIRQIPGINRYATRAHTYDAAGHESFDSEWADCTDPLGDCLAVPPAGTTSSNFDPLGRAQTVRKADGSLTCVSYADANPPTVTCGAASANYSDTQKSVKVCINGQNTGSGGSCTGTDATTTYKSDAFGRLTSVTEPGGDVTYYGYDVNGKLASVWQGGQNRAFTYDPFGFLRSETTPEKGTFTYEYGSLGNVLSETYAGTPSLVVSRSYDFAGRVKTIATDESGARTYLSNTYNDSVSGNSLGKLTSRVASNYTDASNATTTDSFSYGGLGGRLSAQNTQISGTPNLSQTQSWTYNGLGLVSDHHHYQTPDPGQPLVISSSPARFVVTTGYDAGMPVAQYVNGIPMIKGVAYQPGGGLASYTTGPGTGTDVTTTITPDGSLPRPRSIATSGASPNFSTGTYRYDGAGNILEIGPGSSGDDTFTYDALSRLIAADYSQSGSQSYTYDALGNLLTKGGTPFCSPTCTNNQITGATYVRGNLTTYAGEDFAWDGLDRMTKSGPHLSGPFHYYLYDGADERVAKIPPTGGWTYTLRDESKRATAEFATMTDPPPATVVASRDNVFLGNQVVLSYANLAVGGNDRAWSFYASDHLGTPRMTTDLAGVSSARKYWPFGDAVTAEGSGQALRFAAMEFDAEGGTGSLAADRYYDHARTHVGGLGRFLSPDPKRATGRVDDPQSWNRYTYSLNNPIVYVDPDGLDVDLGAITNGDKRLLLIKQLSDKTGLDLVDNDGRLLSLGVLKDTEGNTMGSAVARDDLLSAINSKDTFFAREVDNSPLVNMGMSTGKLISLDFADIAKIDTGKLNPATFDAATIFLHELAHSMLGLKDPSALQLKATPGLMGKNVQHENEIRKQLNLPIRLQYRTEERNGRTYIPFQGGPVYVPGGTLH